jgi:hypothetical protein
MMNKLLLTGIGALILAGCAIDGHRPHVGVGLSIGGGPHHYRGGPNHYHYYPASGVYRNVNTGGYFYLNGGAWQVAMTLPSTVVLDTGNYVRLELETDRPYLYHDAHKVKYKGKFKYKGHGRSKKHGHGKKHWKK